MLLCDRHVGVGSDGILLHCPPTGAVPGAVASMRIFNPDGSESEMCGNGIRIFARYLAATRGRGGARVHPRDPCRSHQPRGFLRTGRVRVDMGRARFVSANIDTDLVPPTAADGVIDAVLEAPGCTYRFTFVDVGNPHCVILVDDPADCGPARSRRAIEKHPASSRTG